MQPLEDERTTWHQRVYINPTQPYQRKVKNKRKEKNMVLFLHYFTCIDPSQKEV
jgi:hypothetical protein